MLSFWLLMSALVNSEKQGSSGVYLLGYLLVYSQRFYTVFVSAVFAVCCCSKTHWQHYALKNMDDAEYPLLGLSLPRQAKSSHRGQKSRHQRLNLVV